MHYSKQDTCSLNVWLMPFMFIQTPQRQVTTSDRAVTYPPTAESGWRPTVTSRLIWSLRKLPLKPHPSLFHSQICIPVSYEAYILYIFNLNGYEKYLEKYLDKNNLNIGACSTSSTLYMLLILGILLRHECVCLCMLLHFSNAWHEGDKKRGRRRDILSYAQAQNIDLLTTETPSPFQKNCWYIETANLLYLILTLGLR